MNSKLRPWYRRLAMGDAWSVFFLMGIEFARIQNALFRGPKLKGFVLLNMLHLYSHRTVVHASQGSLYLHVDDLVVNHEDLGMVLSALLILSTALRALGFIVKVTWPHEVEKVIGLCPQLTMLRLLLVFYIPCLPLYH